MMIGGAIMEDMMHGPKRPYDEKTKVRFEDEVEDVLEK
jgi:hypothetical protein